jgi:hypothetical protein
MIAKRFSQIFLGLMGLAFCKVGVEALVNPQAVLNSVGIILDNASALSSMRAVYGGLHFVFGAFCIYGIFKNPQAPLTIVLLYTIGFTIGRISGIMVDGRPNEFVITWLITEVVSGTLALTALVLLNKQKAQ